MSAAVIPVIDREHARAAVLSLPVPVTGAVREEGGRIIDTRGRPLRDLRISVTDACNFRCRYCMPDGGIEKCAHEDICSLEELRDMAAAAVRCGVKKIRVTGGEPLVRRGAVDFCRMLSSIAGVEELCVTTNGSLLRELAQPLRDVGVTHLNISLDTLN